MRKIELAIELSGHLKECLEIKKEFELRVKKSKKTNFDLRWKYDHQKKVKRDMELNKIITLSYINRIRILLNDLIKSL